MPLVPIAIIAVASLAIGGGAYAAGEGAEKITKSAVVLTGSYLAVKYLMKKKVV
ncbi:MAG: hypothetical protein V6Z82_07000 [Flavobacteriales bacterium]